MKVYEYIKPEYFTVSSTKADWYAVTNRTYQNPYGLHEGAEYKIWHNDYERAYDKAPVYEFVIDDLNDLSTAKIEWRKSAAPDIDSDELLEVLSGA